MLGEVAARPPPTAAPPASRAGPAGEAPKAGGAWRGLVQGAFDAERELDAVMKAARGGKTFSANELLELQTKVFRYSQAVEIVSRGTDRLVGAVKQALGTQV